MHAERDTVTAIPSVCPSFRPVPVLCLNKCTSSHFFSTVIKPHSYSFFLSASAGTKFKILHGNQSGHEENFFQGGPRMLTRDLFAVAKVLVLSV